MNLLTVVRCVSRKIKVRSHPKIGYYPPYKGMPYSKRAIECLGKGDEILPETLTLATM